MGGERERSASLEQQERIAHVINSSHSGEASIRSPKERDRSRHHLAHRGGLRLSTGTRPYGDCWSTLCCLAVWSIRMGRVQYGPDAGWAALESACKNRPSA